MWAHNDCMVCIPCTIEARTSLIHIEPAPSEGQIIVEEYIGQSQVLLTMVMFTQIKPQMAAIMADNFHLCLSPCINMPWKYPTYHNNGTIIIFSACSKGFLDSLGCSLMKEVH